MNFANLIGYKTAIEIIRKQIVDHVKHDVNDFIIEYVRNDKTLKFKVFLPANYTLLPGYDSTTRSRLYNWDDSEFLANQFEAIAASKLKGETIDGTLITYSKNSPDIDFKIFYRDADGNKLLITHKL